MRCRGSTPGSFERPSQRALSRQIAHSGGTASSARSAHHRHDNRRRLRKQRIQALSSQRPAGSRGGNPHRDMGRRPGRRPVGGLAPGRLPYARTQEPSRRADRPNPRGAGNCATSPRALRRTPAAVRDTSHIDTIGKLCELNGQSGNGVLVKPLGPGLDKMQPPSTQRAEQLAHVGRSHLQGPAVIDDQRQSHFAVHTRDRSRAALTHRAKPW